MKKSLLLAVVLVLVLVASASADGFERLGQFADPPNDSLVSHHQHGSVTELVLVTSVSLSARAG